MAWRDQVDASYNPPRDILSHPEGGTKSAHLVDHIGQQAFHLVVVDPLLAAEADSSGKLGDRHAGAADGFPSFLCLLEAAGDEHLAQQVAQRNVTAPFQREVDATFDELILALLKGEVKLVELAPFDASAEWQEEFLQSRKRLQQCLGWERVVRY